MEQWIQSDACTGCAACENICPTNAIQMPWDKDGYFHPVIDEAVCNDCGACRRVCPVLKRLNGIEVIAVKKRDEPEIFAAWSKDFETRYNSASGGVFSELAEKMLEKGAHICGAAYYGEKQLVKHCLVDSELGLQRVRQSKYIQSEIGKVFRAIKQKLSRGDSVLFCGTPCQVAGLYAYLGEDHNNLVTVDFICRGVNSPMVYRTWIEDLEEQYGGKATRIWFKNKEKGWNNYSTRIDFENKRKYQKSRYDDLFMRAFLEKNLFIRPACTRCQFKGIPKLGNITLADFWKIDKKFDDDLGTNMVVVNDEKGARLFEEIKPMLEVHRRTYEEALKGNVCLTNSVEAGEKSGEFFELLHNGCSFSKAFKIIAGEQQPLVSVVIPMVKRNNNLKECVKSICAQVDSRLEILLIRTTTDDVSKACCEEIAIMDSRIRYITIQGDANIARNTAMNVAKGDYFHFCTGNEMLEEGFYSKLISQMEENKANVACFGWIDNNSRSMCKDAFNGTGNGFALMDAALTDCGHIESYTGYGAGLWNKLFRRDAIFLDETPITFETYQYGMTDSFWLMNIAYNSETVLFMADALLHYKEKEMLISANANMNLTDFFAKEAAVLTSIEKTKLHIYDKLLRKCLDYEIDLLVSAKDQNFSQMYICLKEHVLVFHELPWTKEEELNTYYQYTKVRRDRTFLKNKVIRFGREIDGLKQDRVFLKNNRVRLERELDELKREATRLQKELKDLYSSKLVRIALKSRHLFRRVRRFFKH